MKAKSLLKLLEGKIPGKPDGTGPYGRWQRNRKNPCPVTGKAKEETRAKFPGEYKKIDVHFKENPKANDVYFFSTNWHKNPREAINSFVKRVQENPQNYKKYKGFDLSSYSEDELRSKLSGHYAGRYE